MKISWRPFKKCFETLQKQPPEVFCKKRYSKDFRKFTGNICVRDRDSFLKSCTPTQLFICEICEIFNSSYFEEHLRTTASNTTKMKLKMFYTQLFFQQKYSIRIRDISLTYRAVTQ